MQGDTHNRMPREKIDDWKLNWILTTTWTARTCIIQMLNRPFCNQFDSHSLSFSFVLTLFRTYLIWQTNLIFSSFQWYAINKREKKSTYDCVWECFLELDVQKPADSWERLFSFSSCVCIHFLRNKMHYWFNWTQNILKHLNKIALHNKTITLAYLFIAPLKRN